MQVTYPIYMVKERDNRTIIFEKCQPFYKTSVPLFPFPAADEFIPEEGGLTTR